MWQTLSEFVADWNNKHKHFGYAFFYGSGVKRPTGIEVRYSATKYRSFLRKAETWVKLVTTVEAMSKGTMFVVTDEWLFQRGVLEIKIASYSINYQDQCVINVLKWLGEDFFGDLD